MIFINKNPLRDYVKEKIMNKKLLFLTLALAILQTSNYAQPEESDVQRVRNLYLDMIKRTILNTIYEPNPLKEEGRIRPSIAHSMIGNMRMDNIKYCMEDVLANNVPGDFIETGVWRGGAVIFMRGILKAHNITNRIVWVADSFEGLPAPNALLYPADQGAYYHHINYLKVGLETVINNFKSYGLLDNQVIFLKGWFKDTLKTALIKNIAVLRLDGDMYESTTDALEALYDKVSPGGYIIVDDWCLATAQTAVLDFRSRRGITDPITEIDGIGSFWKKSK